MSKKRTKDLVVELSEKINQLQQDLMDQQDLNRLFQKRIYELDVMVNPCPPGYMKTLDGDCIKS